MAKSRAPETPHKTKPKQGKSERGTAYVPARLELSTPSAPDELKALERRRPSTTRYPISSEQFDKLEKAATKAKVPARKTTVVHRDQGATNRRELAAAG